MIVQFDRHSTAGSIADAIRRDGVCILRDVYADGRANLAEAFEQSFIRLPPAHTHIAALNPQEQRLVRTNWNEEVAQTMPELADIACNPLFLDIGDAYFRGQHRSAHSVYVNECYGLDQRSSNNQFKLHFDKAHSLKWFVYIDDVDVEDGPLEVVPGEHRRHLDIRLAQYRSTSPTDMNGNIDAAGFDGRILPLPGPAGTVIIFDTDVPHRAGHVMPGRRRRIIRSHSCSLAMYAGMMAGRFADGDGLRSHC